jgi:predicted RNase H-like HicB family nuclease
MKHLQLSIAVWKEGKYFVARCLNVEVSSFGNTKNAAIKNLNEALALYFEEPSGRKINKLSKPELITSEFTYA